MSGRLRVIRSLRTLVGRNITGDVVLHPKEELLSEPVDRLEYARSPQCHALLGALWPTGFAVERLAGDRFANGYALIVGREGADWEVVEGRERQHGSGGDAAPRGFQVTGFFDMLANHLRSRSAEVRSLAVMGAMEHWMQFEAAALVDLNRTPLGIDGRKPDGQPRFWVACEPSKVDLWIEGEKRATAVEFKMVHNNKNLRAHVVGLRRDLDPGGAKKTPATSANVSRFGIIASVWVHFVPGYGNRYPVLKERGSRQPVSMREFDARIRSALALEHGGYPKLKIVGGPVEITSLETAHYVDPKFCGVVQLWLVAPTPQRLRAARP